MIGERSTTTAAATNCTQSQTGDRMRTLQKRALLSEIRGKWGKFSEQELPHLRNDDDLAGQLAAKYRLQKDIAQSDWPLLCVGGRSRTDVSGVPGVALAD
jgi:hypothetical protein